MPWRAVERFTLVLGTVPGYGHTNEGAATLREATEIAIGFLGEIQRTTGVYLSFIVTAGRCGYPEEFGCPPGGEEVISLTGERNPLFQAVPKEYRLAWEMLAKLMKEHYKQTTARLTWEKVNLLYMKKVQDTARERLPR